MLQSTDEAVRCAVLGPAESRVKKDSLYKTVSLFILWALSDWLHRPSVMVLTLSHYVVAIVAAA